MEINPAIRCVGVVRVSDEDRKMYIGGKGLGLKRLYEWLMPDMDALGKNN